MFLPHQRVKVSIVGSLRDREVACSASDRQGSNFASCVWRTVSSQSSHHPQEVLLARFSLYVHKGGLKPDSFHFIYVVLYIPENRLNFPTTNGFRMKISMKLVDQYMAIFFTFSPTSSHLHPLQVKNCDSNSRLVVDENDNDKFRLERINITFAVLIGP